MNISFLARKLNIAGGGSNISLDAMASRLQGRGHDVTVITHVPAENATPPGRAYRVIDRSVPGRLSTYTLSLATYRTMRRHANHTDLFHVFDPNMLPGAGIHRMRHATPVVGRLNAVNVVCTNPAMMDGRCHRNCTVARKFAHDPAGWQKKLIKTVSRYPTQQFVEPSLMSRVDRLFALSTGIAEVYASNGVASDRMRIVPNFYRPDASPDDRPDDERDGEFTVVFVGRLTANKRVDVLLRAVAMMASPRPRVRIVGDGRLRADLEALVDDLGIPEDVAFLGRVDHRDVYAQYGRADVMVHPMNGPYTFSRTLLEALQLGLPAVVSDAGDAMEMMEGVGFTFQKQDPVALAAVLRELMERPTLLEETSERCKAVKRKFAPEPVVDDIEQEYRSLVGA